MDPITLGELKASGYKPKSVHDELRENLITALKSKKRVFEDIWGYDDTVIPDVERALLSRHNILLLGLRGQAKTRIARLMINLLDEYVPVVAGSEINDDPLQPISRFAIDLIAEKGDQTPVAWLHRSERYVEKLATPDVSVADLVGDVDPIKAATLKLPYSDERVIHFGLIPRAHRCIFAINELPDLQPRIQVSLFNILQEGDIQIRGFKLRLPLDLHFVFTANPEDYTNRGNIITPLKDRIESQILTHYPIDLNTAVRITRSEATHSADQLERVKIPEMLEYLLEDISFAARDSALIDEKSGVSARLSISGRENLLSTAERRMLINGEASTQVRLTDFWGVIPSITGKVELVYEGEQEGPHSIAMGLISIAIKNAFIKHFPHPEMPDETGRDYYSAMKMWFNEGNVIYLQTDETDAGYRKDLEKVPGLLKLVKEMDFPVEEYLPFMELALHGLAEFDIISKDLIEPGLLKFQDDLAQMLDDDMFGNDDDDDDDDIF